MDNSNQVDIVAELVHKDGSINVKEKLAQVNANVGTEGAASFYLCEIVSDSGNVLAESILCIFIALHEEFTCKLIARHPENFTGSDDAMNALLEAVAMQYAAFCKVERSCLSEKNLH